jgi:hypothetical protein
MKGSIDAEYKIIYNNNQYNFNVINTLYDNPDI